MSAEGNKFVEDITTFVEKTKVAPDLVLRKIAFDCLRVAMFLSPVKEGRFRGNWRLSVNRVDLSIDGGGSSAGKKAGSDVQEGEMGAVRLGNLAEAKFGDTIYISNNLPYAKRLEEGWSKQAPQGVLQRSFDYVLSVFQKNVEIVKREL